MELGQSATSPCALQHAAVGVDGRGSTCPWPAVALSILVCQASHDALVSRCSGRPGASYQRQARRAAGGRQRAGRQRASGGGVLEMSAFISPTRQAADVLPQCTTATRLLQGTEAPQRHWQQSPWRGCWGVTPFSVRVVRVWHGRCVSGCASESSRRCTAEAQACERASMLA